MKIKSLLLASMIVGSSLIGSSAFAAEKTVNLTMASDMEGGYNAHFGNNFSSADMSSVFSDKYMFTLGGAYDSSASVTSSFLKSGTIKDLLITSFSIVQYDPLSNMVLHTYAGSNTTGGMTDNWELSANGLTAGSYYVQVGGTVVGNGGGSYGSDLTISMAPVPEPETYAMMLGGLGLMGFVARRKKAKAA